MSQPKCMACRTHSVRVHKHQGCQASELYSLISLMCTIDKPIIADVHQEAGGIMQRLLTMLQKSLGLLMHGPAMSMLDYLAAMAHARSKQ